MQQQGGGEISGMAGHQHTTTCPSPQKRQHAVLSRCCCVCCQSPVAEHRPPRLSAAGLTVILPVSGTFNIQGRIDVFLLAVMHGAQLQDRQASRPAHLVLSGAGCCSAHARSSCFCRLQTAR